MVTTGINSSQIFSLIIPSQLGRRRRGRATGRRGGREDRAGDGGRGGRQDRQGRNSIMRSPESPLEVHLVVVKFLTEIHQNE